MLVCTMRMHDWRINASRILEEALFTDYRRPLKTFLSSFRAAIGLYFYKESFT